MKKLFVMICALCSQLLMAQTVGPLIQTQWDQAAPFNCMIPEKDGQHCLASCGAAAMAQICYYHRWPEHGMGEGDWHFDDGNPVRTDLTQDYYEYDKMLLTYNESSSEEALKATALLIRDVAFLGAVFSLEESFSPSVQGLAMCFGYDKGMLHLDRDYCTDEDFKAVIRAELDAGRPVYMSGSNSSMGHSFVCDGYRDNDEFHFNYGWAGKYDGWATLEDFLFPVSMTIDYNIKTEKRLELCCEAIRYQDLIRWGDAKSVMGNQGKEVPAFTTDGVQWNWQNTTYGFQDKNMLLPIPLKELELNPNMTQNTGW